ncbi:hypothetical protein RFI_17752 [Reticulomyxa filosa]|uniref:Uncharacterized protein n=1 Tax=Reticulomyxa filosa TaxID=46433 RepID=X6N0Q9_RETFI|nr:hypothetical protein RFI_17752 [Reticulomyxa filosa]|eukprot:ETO19478.1 hypothetical protein RFI_17752 [Reticulomyxa filosa]
MPIPFDLGVESLSAMMNNIVPLTNGIHNYENINLLNRPTTAVCGSFTIMPLCPSVNVPQMQSIHAFSTPNCTTVQHMNVHLKPTHNETNAHQPLTDCNGSVGLRRVPILGQPPRTNYVHVGANACRERKQWQAFLLRARRILRLQNSCIIGGTGEGVSFIVLRIRARCEIPKKKKKIVALIFFVSIAVAVVCEVVEQLKREKTAIVANVRSGLNEFNEELDEYEPVLEIWLQKGEYGLVRGFFFFSSPLSPKKKVCVLKLVSDFRRRKVIEIFELHDTEMQGELSIQSIEHMKLPDKFHANAHSRLQAELFIKNRTSLCLKGFCFFLY